MDRFRNLIPLALVVFLGILVQVVLVAAETKDAPGRAAVAFTKAFYSMSPGVTQYMCSDLMAEEDLVDGRFYEAAAEARTKGFSEAYPRMQLFHVQAVVLAQDEAAAQVKLTCTMKRAIHPAFAYFLKMWNMGATYHLDEVVDLIHEDGRWKVCGYDYALVI
jgi:hypothetical protein